MARDLIEGMQGEDVRALQNGLNEYFGSTRAPLVPDGKFGSATRGALEAFQLRNPGTGRRDGKPDLIAGTRTHRRLFPLVPYTASLVGMRLRMPQIGARRGAIRPPNLGPGPLRPPGSPAPGPVFNPSPFPRQIDWMRLLPSMMQSRIDFRPTKFPGLSLPIVVPPPVVVPMRALEAPLPVPPPRPGGLVPQKIEIAPGATMGAGGPADTAFSIAISGVYLMGDDEGPHGEFAFGTEIGSPSLDGSGGWLINWFVQVAAIDYLRAKGRFHWFQPYAQLSGENATSPIRPVFKAKGAPLNLSYDITKQISVTADVGVIATYDPDVGRITASVEGSAGLSISFDMIPPPRPDR